MGTEFFHAGSNVTLVLFSQPIINLPVFSILILALGYVIAARTWGLRKLALEEKELWVRSSDNSKLLTQLRTCQIPTAFGERKAQFVTKTPQRRLRNWFTMKEPGFRPQVIAADVGSIFPYVAERETFIRQFASKVPPGWKTTTAPVSGRSLTAMDPTPSRILTFFAGLLFVIILITTVYVANS